jgi:hypothetical protein
MTTQKTVTVPAPNYSDHDDCLQAAEAAYIADHPDLEGWDLDPRWADGVVGGERDKIELTVPW